MPAFGSLCKFLLAMLACFVLRRGDSTCYLVGHLCAGQLCIFALVCISLVAAQTGKACM